MRKLTPKIAVALAGAIVLAVGLGAAGAIAASRARSPSDESKAVIDDAAGRLGVEPSALTKALKEALKARVDAAVDAGRLTEAQGNALKDRIESGDGPFFDGLGGFWHGGLGHVGHVGGLDAAATYLGIDESDLHSQLHDGKTLAEIAKAEGKTVDGLVQAMVKAAEARLDEAVADGKLTQAQADEISKGLEERVTALVNGGPPERGFGFGHRFGEPGPPFGDRLGPGFHRHGLQA